MLVLFIVHEYELFSTLMNLKIKTYNYALLENAVLQYIFVNKIIKKMFTRIILKFYILSIF